jgi:hypothetical protein
MFVIIRDDYKKNYLLKKRIKNLLLLGKKNIFFSNY